FEKKVLDHQQKVQDYQDKVKKDLNELRIDRSKMTNQLLKKIDKILLEYVENNKIDMIVKKESLIISNSKWDITNFILKNLDLKYKSIE
ncbi:OmpH family outer membrane protein, partial [Candidatus Pelagibacter sp.]|nr:OmpH family outer membrane protein [Candidatus Pelagibacter sp.]